jgi:hypothetical protein
MWADTGLYIEVRLSPQQVRHEIDVTDIGDEGQSEMSEGVPEKQILKRRKRMKQK